MRGYHAMHSVTRQLRGNRAQVRRKGATVRAVTARKIMIASLPYPARAARAVQYCLRRVRYEEISIRKYEKNTNLRKIYEYTKNMRKYEKYTKIRQVRTTRRFVMHNTPALLSAVCSIRAATVSGNFTTKDRQQSFRLGRRMPPFTVNRPFACTRRAWQL